MDLSNFSVVYVVGIFVEKIRNQCSDLSVALVRSVKSGYSTFFQEPLNRHYTYGRRLQGRSPFLRKPPNVQPKQGTPVADAIGVLRRNFPKR